MTESLTILHLELTGNTPDTDLHNNLVATKARNLAEIAVGDIQTQPLILCGSGPSLDDYFPAVRTMYPDAPIMAVNGAYQHIRSKYGIVPRYYAQLDARDCNAKFVENPDPDTTFLLASQVHPNVFDQIPPEQIRVFHLNAPSAKEVFPKAGLLCGSGGGTIGTTAMLLGAILGFRHQALLGMDSSYRDGRSHICDQPQNAEYKTIPVYVDDREYQTTTMMAKQVEQFRPFLKGLTTIFPDLDVRLFGHGLLYDYLLSGQSRERTRETEAAQYQELYEDPTYGMSEFREDAIKLALAGRPRGSLLDVGTGRGETLKIAKKFGFEPVRGTETVPALCGPDVTMALLPNLPFADASFDTVTCFEVIEHLLPEDVVPALQEIARAAKDRVLVSVCTAPDVRGGVNLHPSARSETEWEEAFRVAWGESAYFVKVGQASSLGVSPIYELLK